MSLDPEKSLFHSCCCKLVCNGCIYANYISSGNTDCPFCRDPGVDGEEENEKRVMERVKANDTAAMHHMGGKCYKKGDYPHPRLGLLYWMGEGVEKDEEKKVYHWEKAAIGGHPKERYHLGCFEWRNGNMERSVKHLIIAAKLGEDRSMKALWEQYSAGNINKEELESTLRAHKAAIDATKSAQRDAGEAYFREISAS